MSGAHDGISQAAKVLLAAHQLEQEGQTPFSAEALVVQAWQMFPAAFGLRGFWADYPDANRVLSACMGARGLVARGMLAKLGQKLYAMTHKGRAMAWELLGTDEREAAYAAAVV